MVGRLFLAVPWGCLRFAIVVFPDHTIFHTPVCVCKPVDGLYCQISFYTHLFMFTSL